MNEVVTLSVSSRDDAKTRLAAAFRGEPQGNRISFLSVEQMRRTQNPKRWDILQAITGQGTLSIREVARRVGRDVKAVHGDVHALLNAGVIERAGRGVVFPYTQVRLDFTWGVAT